MSKGGVNVLDLPTKGRCSLTEKGGEIILNAGDPVSAMQAVARQANLQIGLTPVEAERLVSAGRFKISLRYVNSLSGATEAVQRIDRLISEAARINHEGISKGRSIWTTLGLLVLAVVIGAVMFVGTVVVLDNIFGSNTLSQFLR